MIEHSPSPSSPAPETPARSSAMAGVKRALIALGVLVIIWFVFGLVAPQFLFPEQTAPSPVAAPAQLDSQQESLAAFEARITRLEAKLTALEEAVTALPSVATPAPVAENGVPVSAPVDDERLTRLEEKLAELEAQATASKTKVEQTISAVTAFHQLKEAVFGGKAFAHEHTALATRIGEYKDAQPLLAQLAPYAEIGIPTLTKLTSQFESLAPKAIAQGARGGVIGQVQSLITVRKVGEPEGADDASILARAEAKLARSDVAGASAELSSLSPPARSVMSPWLEAEKSYQQAGSLLSALEKALVQNDSAEPAAPAQ